ncbi:hypothetical protein ACFL2Q_06560 [Thermodesulfobacteriota bacterium]
MTEETLQSIQRENPEPEDHPGEDFALPAEDIADEIQRSGSLDGNRRDRYITYGIIASLVLHLVFFMWVPRLAQRMPAKKLPKPPQATPVRLVEYQKPKPKPEPAPKNPEALSDRNNTAKKRRLPMARPAKPGILNPVKPKPQIAMLKPPVAPEVFLKPKEDKPKEKAKPKPKPKPNPDN